MPSHAAVAAPPERDEDRPAARVGCELGAGQRHDLDAGDVGCGQAAQVGGGLLRRTFQLAAVHVDFRPAGAVDRDAVVTQPYARRPRQQFGAVLSRECGRIPDADHEPVGLPCHRLGGHRHLADSERCKGQIPEVGIRCGDAYLLFEGPVGDVSQYERVTAVSAVSTKPPCVVGRRARCLASVAQQDCRGVADRGSRPPGRAPGGCVELRPGSSRRAAVR